MKPEHKEALDMMTEFLLSAMTEKETSPFQSVFALFSNLDLILDEEEGTLRHKLEFNAPMNFQESGMLLTLGLISATQPENYEIVRQKILKIASFISMIDAMKQETINEMPEGVVASSNEFVGDILRLVYSFLRTEKLMKPESFDGSKQSLLSTLEGTLYKNEEPPSDEEFSLD